ncbi:hypothetical protein BCR43DRAFT_448395 [Syncephalastrum racemosum]|uniref:Tc1-like transposase DDE domain-containing protein n=1 Tax=Syncephalastrum racemosum TaxID=13706 RepID=A0A1X2GZ46_SYNRA|nr:hypothetical protein BCR43DRAFT_448395 [Syncephalastrum racemosum]
MCALPIFCSVSVRFLGSIRFGFELEPKPKIFGYFSETLPIEQFWSLVKRKIKRTTYADHETLMTRIADTCNELDLQNFRAITKHSADCFEKCRNKEML